MKSKVLDAEMKKKIEQRIKEIEEDIGSKVVDDYHKEIIKTIGWVEMKLLLMVQVEGGYGHY